MQNPMSLVFFVVFGLILFGMYVLVRRRIGPSVVVSVVGVIASMVCITLMTLAQGNTIVWAVVMGIVIGAMFSAVALAAAWYFSTNEARKAQFDPYVQPPAEEVG